MDVDGIEPGLNFVKALSGNVEACDVLLAVIGPTWLEVRDDHGQRRLDNPNDFVRIELEAALKRDVRVIPVLVDGAPMPRSEELPEPLRELSQRQAVRLVHERFGADADGLATALEKIVPPWRDAPSSCLGRFSKPSPEKPKASPENPWIEPRLIKSANVVTRPEREVESDQADHKSKEVRAGKWNIGVAAFFAIFGFPATVALVFLPSVQSFFIIEPEIAKGVTSLLVPTLIAPAALRRGSAITTLEIGIYWVGCEGALMFAVFFLLWAADPAYFGFAAAAGVFVIVVSTAYLIVRRGPLIGTLELLLYWLSCALPLIFVVIGAGYGPREDVRYVFLTDEEVLYIFLACIPALAIVTCVAVWAYWRKSRRLV
jgi:hypothetical protein